MSLKRKEYKVNNCAEKAARFFVAYKANPVRKTIPAAMRGKGYTLKRLDPCPAGAPPVSKNKLKNAPCAEIVAVAPQTFPNTFNSIILHGQHAVQSCH
jgi:hypothetical protein